MLAQLKYAYMDIIENKRFYITQFVLCLTTFLLLGYCVSIYSDLTDMKNTLSRLINEDDTYIISDVTDADTYINKIAKNENREWLYELFLFIEQYQHYRVSYIGSVYDEAIGDVDVVTMDENAMNIFEIGFLSEENMEIFLKGEYGGYIPVAIGYELRNVYKIGDTIADYYKVVGVLKKDSFYLKPSFSPDMLMLNKSILCISVINSSSGIYELNTAITNTHIITDDVNDLYEIVNKSSELGLYSLQFTSVSHQIDGVFEQELRGVKYALVFIVMSIALSVVCMVSAMMVYVQKHMREFAIHFMYGATYFSINLRMFFQICAMYLLACLIACIIYADTSVMLYLLLIFLILTIAVLTIPVISLRRNGITKLLRRSE